ncbi:MAG: hypothetical protein ACI36Y_04540 [Coriobacteriales bacterium]
MKKLAGCLGGFAVGAAVYLLCGGVGLSQQGLACLAILCWAIVWWVAGVLPDVINQANASERVEKSRGTVGTVPTVPFPFAWESADVSFCVLCIQ